jgi:hypothetical protein
MAHVDPGLSVSLPGWFVIVRSVAGTILFVGVGTGLSVWTPSCQRDDGLCPRIIPDHDPGIKDCRIHPCLYGTGALAKEFAYVPNQ